MKNQITAKPQDVASAFQTFNKLTQRLIDSYQELEEQVCVLQTDLESRESENPVPAEQPSAIPADSEILLESIPAAIILLDNKGQVAQANNFAVTLLERNLLGQLWRDIVTDTFIPRDDDGHEISLANGRRVSICTSPMSNGRGQLILINDVTEARELQEKVNLYQRLSSMGEMAASLAHQIRTPLSTALLYTSHLKSDQLDFAKRVEITDKLSNRLQHMESLIKDMLLFVRGGVSGQEQINANDLLTELFSNFQQRFHEKSINISYSDSCRCLIKGNHDALLSALGNLLENCLQHCAAQAKVHIETKTALNDYVDFIVRDDGPGIPEQAQARVQEPFFTTHTGGTGLGLAVVDAVARAHNGYMWFQSEAGKGSVFSVRLPIFRSLDSEHKNSISRG